MKSIHFLLMAVFLQIIISANAQQYPEEIPEDATWSIVMPEEGKSSPPMPQFSPLESNNDFRILPTTNSTQSEMSVAVSPLNHNVVLVSANASSYPPPLTFYGTGVYWSTDGGNHWQGYDIPPPGYNKGDPAAAIDLAGNFYVGSVASNFGQEILKSTDGGDTWSYFQITGPTTDKNHLAVDNSPTSSHSGNLYLAWSDFNYQDRRITVARSTDQGETWLDQQVISSGFAGFAHQGINLQVSQNGTVYACWAVRDKEAPFTERGIGLNKSTDGGASWQQATYAIQNIYGIRTPNSGPYFEPYDIGANSFPSMAISQITGYIYIV